MPPAVAVAASGGRDSTALLHCTARQARELGLMVHALHVHHGLVDGADEWLRRLSAQCRRWAASGLPVTLHAQRLVPAVARGESVEAWARRERYRALAALAREADCDVVLLAHHRRDQAETLLLQALRGGGPAGLAAMPRSVVRDGLSWARPWLDLPREAIEAYLRHYRLSWSEDTSNDDRRLSRNRLRARVWPALTRAFPDAEAQLHAAATRAAEASACLSELAALDLRVCENAGALLVEPWCRLSDARRANMLRTWLRETCPGAPQTLVRRLVVELPLGAAARWPAPGGELRLHHGRLSFGPKAVDVDGQASALALDISEPGRYSAPGWGGAVVVANTASGGVAATRLRCVWLRPRHGGESFQLAPRSQPRSLKKQFQARRVPAWQRGGPLVYDGQTLLFVPGLGLDARELAQPGEVQRQLHWELDPTG